MGKVFEVALMLEDLGDDFDEGNLEEYLERQLEKDGLLVLEGSASLRYLTQDSPRRGKM